MFPLSCSHSCSPAGVRRSDAPAILFSKCGNKIFALWKIQLKFRFIFNRLMIQSPIHACTWAVRVLRFLNKRHYTSGCAHHNSAKTTWANTVTRTHRPNKCLVMPMWKGSYCKFMQVHAQLHLRGLAIDWKYCIWPKLNDNNQTRRTDLVKHLAFTNVLT